jgi:hypothetical protein
MTAAPLSLDSIRNCLEGAIPGTMATCAADGTPNVAYLSQVEYVDSHHIALSFQFFNKTRSNVLENPVATLLVTDPATGAMYRLRLRYLRTETDGALFERMKAKLAGIASHTGMSGIFRLRGADIYRVADIERISGNSAPPQPPERSVLAALRQSALRLQRCADLDSLLNTTLQTLRESFAIDHAMILLLDPAPHMPPRLFTVASIGYAESGIGAEIAVGDGVIGIAAQMRTPIRIGHTTSEYGYGRAARAASIEAGLDDLLETEIPLPGLCDSHSQLAVPMLALDALMGVLYVESAVDSRFGYEDEDALVALAVQLGLGIRYVQHTVDAEPPAAAVPAIAQPPAGAPVTVRYYAHNHSVFIGEDYLIKGVAGAILWALLQDHAGSGRRHFTNRELRLDARIRLPELSDNLEARLILLTRRLEERKSCVQIKKCGRGQFELAVARPLRLRSISA